MSGSRNRSDADSGTETDSVFESPAPISDGADEAASSEGLTAGDGVSDRDARDLERPIRRRRWPAVLGTFVLLIGLAIGGGFLWLQGQIDPSGPPGEEVVVEVPEGATSDTIAGLLADEGVIANRTVFEYYVKYKSIDTSTWQAGPHAFQENSSIDEAIVVLDAGPGVDAIPQVTIPEGFSVFASAGLPKPGPVVKRITDPVEGIKSLDQKDVMSVLLSNEIRSAYQPKGTDSLEGLLFPDTYRLEDGEGAKQLVDKMVKRFDEVARELGYDDATDRIRRATGGEIDISAYEAIVVASMIERETLVAEERGMVARVIYNRLAIGNPLGIDATTVYALGRPLETQADVDFASPYNTRNNQGLPPGPIGLPGRASLEAALNPTPGDWFYYVLEDKEGNHFFTADEREFINKQNECADKGLC